MKGELTIKGITRAVDLPVKLLGVTDLPEELQKAFGGIEEVASFEATLTVDRRDFGVGVGSWALRAWSRSVPLGGGTDDGDQRDENARGGQGGGDLLHGVLLVRSPVLWSSRVRGCSGVERWIRVP